MVPPDRLGAQGRLRPGQRGSGAAHDRPRQGARAGARPARRHGRHRDARPHRRRALRAPQPALAAKLASAHNDYILERYLEPEPRLRGLIAISPQNPQAAANEIRRVGGRDEFVGIFLPGGARVPYGNPIHDPIWEAANELALPVVVHTHYEGVGIAGPVTAAGYPDFYVEYHTLCGSGMYGHFVSILCHGIFERFPDTKVMMVEGGLVPFVGLMWRLDTNWKACRSEIPWCRKPPSEYVWDHVRFSSQPLETPEDRRCSCPRSRDCGHGTRSASRATTRTGTTTSRPRRCAPAVGVARERRLAQRSGVLRLPAAVV